MMPLGLLGEIQCSSNSLELYGGRTVRFVGICKTGKYNYKIHQLSVWIIIIMIP